MSGTVVVGAGVVVGPVVVVLVVEVEVDVVDDGPDFGVVGGWVVVVDVTVWGGGGGGVHATATIAVAKHAAGNSSPALVRTCVLCQLKIANPWSLLVLPMLLKSPTAISRLPPLPSARPRTPSTPPLAGENEVVVPLEVKPRTRKVVLFW